MVNIYIEKEKKNRINFFKYEKNRKLLKAIFKNVNLPSQIRQKAFFNLSKVPKNSSLVRLRTRCFLTGRGRFIFSGFCLSRMALRKLANEASLAGIRKACW